MNLSLTSSTQYTGAPPVINVCKDTSEKIDLYTPYGLYIKPIARLNITIQLPVNKLLPGLAPSTISHGEIIEKLKKQILPDEFIYIRILKASMDFIRCEAEVENKSSFKNLLSKLDNCTIRTEQYLDVLRVRAAEAKLIYPNRHEWESFFKDKDNDTPIDMAMSIDQMLPGERPDTVHLSDVPCKWFADRKLLTYSLDHSTLKPSEFVLKDVFSIFGEIRLIDIPLLSSGAPLISTLKKKASSNDLLSSFSQSHLPTFDAYIQYKDYISFVKAMDTFRGMKLLHVSERDGSANTANVKVDFDKTRHLSDKEIQRRKIEGFKNIELEKIKNAQAEKDREKEAKQKEIANFRAMLEASRNSGGSAGEDDAEHASVLVGIGSKLGGGEEKSKEDRRRDREEARRQKRLAKKQQEEERKLEQKIALEERKMLIAQRKLESMRLLEELFNRVKVIVAKEELEKREKELEEERQKRLQEEYEQDNLKKLKFEQEEQELREKVEKNLAEAESKYGKNDSDIGEREEEEFELRKQPLDEVKTTESPTSKQSTESPRSNAPVIPPRAVLLSQQQQQKPSLYDEEDLTPKTNTILDESSQNSEHFAKDLSSQDENSLTV